MGMKERQKNDPREERMEENEINFEESLLFNKNGLKYQISDLKFYKL